MSALPILSGLLLFTWLDGVSAWTTNGAVLLPRRAIFPSSRANTALYKDDSGGVDSLNVENLKNHEEVGSKMAKSIVTWLDKEVRAGPVEVPPLKLQLTRFVRTWPTHKYISFSFVYLKKWMPQEVHVKMAESVKQSYIKCREAGDADVMSIMTTIADDLTAKWSEYDADTFVGPFDISNYVSDYLVKSSGQEGCDCSHEIH